MPRAGVLTSCSCEAEVRNSQIAVKDGVIVAGQGYPFYGDKAYHDWSYACFHENDCAKTITPLDIGMVFIYSSGAGDTPGCISDQAPADVSGDGGWCTRCWAG